MSNLPILYFTLGMLAGLPLGYRVAETWYEVVLPFWTEPLNFIAFTIELSEARA